MDGTSLLVPFRSVWSLMHILSRDTRFNSITLIVSSHSLNTRSYSSHSVCRISIYLSQLNRNERALHWTLLCYALLWYGVSYCDAGLLAVSDPGDSPHFVCKFFSFFSFHTSEQDETGILSRWRERTIWFESHAHIERHRPNRRARILSARSLSWRASLRKRGGKRVKKNAVTREITG